MMKVRFEYPDIPIMHIENICVVGEFNNFNTGYTNLVKNNNTWSCEIELDEGTYLYKFIINNYMYLNDPNANAYHTRGEEVWSYINVSQMPVENSKGKITYLRHIITNRMATSLTMTGTYKEFYMKIDRKVVLGMEWDPIEGLHEVCVIWYRPDTLIHHISYEIIQVIENESKAGTTWFWMPLDEEGREYIEGIWNVVICVDGISIMADQFRLNGRVLERQY